jgi:hypothetical protein
MSSFRSRRVSYALAELAKFIGVSACELPGGMPAGQAAAVAAPGSDVASRDGTNAA